jgi:hypothetical protein
VTHILCHLCGEWQGNVSPDKPSGHLLVKCMDQVCSGKVRWQTVILTNHALNLSGFHAGSVACVSPGWGEMF